MGKKLVIRGADFSANAVPLPEEVTLSALTPNGYYTANQVTENETDFDDVSVHENINWLRWMNEIDVESYDYETQAFTQAGGTSGILNLWIMDTNKIVLKKYTSHLVDGVLTIDGVFINSSNYPTAKYIGFGTDVDSVVPVLLRTAK